MNRRITLFCFCVMLTFAMIPLGSASWCNSSLIQGMISTSVWSEPEALPQLANEDYPGVGGGGTFSDGVLTTTVEAEVADSSEFALTEGADPLGANQGKEPFDQQDSNSIGSPGDIGAPTVDTPSSELDNQLGSIASGDNSSNQTEGTGSDSVGSDINQDSDESSGVSNCSSDAGASTSGESSNFSHANTDASGESISISSNADTDLSGESSSSSGSDTPGSGEGSATDENSSE